MGMSATVFDGGPDNAEVTVLLENGYQVDDIMSEAFSQFEARDAEIAPCVRNLHKTPILSLTSTVTEGSIVCDARMIGGFQIGWTVPQKSVPSYR